MSITVKVEKIISNGYGIGWTEGKTWFIPFVIAGEVIEITQFKKIKKVFYAEEFTITTPSPHRIEPACPNFTKCGGCDFLHIEYAHQLEVKKEILKDHFRQNRLEELFPDEIETVQLDTMANRTRAKVILEEGKGAFHGRKSHDLHPFDTCPLLHPELNRVISDFAKNHSGEYYFEYSTNSKEWMPQQKKIERKVFDQKFAQSQGSFFQSSEHSAELLVTIFNAELERLQPKTVVDLYSGIGLFTAFARRRGLKTVSVENSPLAVDDFKENLPKRTMLQIKAENWAPKASYDLVVADPPRSGLPQVLIESIVKATSNLLYISCDAATFARDVKIFASRGFTLDKLTLIDLFPGTKHFEVAGIFKSEE
ncbi:class I SAM-dependent RNA methyltransferase [bacterium]|nr:class I SAM-dependent RNA methyltransferase [bacterium]